MKKLLIFAIVLFGCSDEHEPTKKICSPFSMTISDAIPVQFWVNGVETFNQKEVCGINSACFCQPFNCDDEIRIQFSDDGDFNYLLSIIDENDDEITSLSFSEMATGIFQLSFIPSEVGVCNEKIHFSIVKDESFENPSFSNGLTHWSSLDQTANSTDWVASNYLGDSSALGNTFKSNAPLGAGQVSDSDLITHSFHQLTPTQRTLTWAMRINAAAKLQISALTLTLSARYYKNGVIVGVTQTVQSGMTESSSHSGTLLTSQSDFDEIRFFCRATYTTTNASNDLDWSFHLLQAELNTIDETVASSDCLDIKTAHDCTQLISYTNSKDFADIEYTTFSPNAEFYIRIPAVFFHERNTEEQERFETSGQTIVRLRDEIKIKRLLEIGFMPDYMHRKLLLILAHDTVEIDSEEWVRNDPYEKVDGNRRYPLKKANVLLTQQGYIKRNIL